MGATKPYEGITGKVSAVSDAQICALVETLRFGSAQRPENLKC